MEGASHWFDVTPGKWIQGLVARWEQERRIYVVTITPEMEDAAYERWPAHTQLPGVIIGEGLAADGCK